MLNSTGSASHLYSSAMPSIKPGDIASPGEQPEKQSGGEVFARYTTDFFETLQKGEETAKQALGGKADPASVVEALAASEIAIEAAVSVRDKVVEAYQEILRMPV